MTDREPELTAQFVIGKDGMPEMLDDDHYLIRIGIENPPDETFAVTYELDPSYHERIRESRASKESFGIEVYSYGDYTVQARVRTKSRTIPIAASLYKSLRRFHGKLVSEPIKKALADIREN